jgi:hypothetical protein
MFIITTLSKMRVHHKIKKPAPLGASKIHHQSVKHKESHFTVEVNEWRQQNYYESEDQPTSENVQTMRTKGID